MTTDNMVRDNRDYTLDYIKTIGCILMLMVHSELLSFDIVAKVARFSGSFAPHFFFTVAGVTAAMQVGRYTTNSILKSYVWFFLASFCLTPLVLHSGQFDVFRYIELLQIIALGAIFVVLIEHFLKPDPWIYLIIALLVGGIKLGVDVLVPEFVVSNYLEHLVFGIVLPPAEGVVYKPENWNALAFPGFPLIPWLMLFPLGVFAWRVQVTVNLLMALALIVSIIILSAAGVNLDLINKWDMSIGNMLLSFAVVSGSFGLLRIVAPWLPQRKCVWNFFGRFSFHYLFAHYPALFIIQVPMLFLVAPFVMTNPDLPWVKFMAPLWQYISWALAISLAFGLTKLIALIPSGELFEKKSTWVALICLMIVTPIVIPIPLIHWPIEYVYGILFVTNWSRFSHTIKQKVS